MQHSRKLKEIKKDTELAVRKRGVQTRHTRLPGPTYRFFNHDTRRYETVTGNRWPVDDETKWIEYRLREREIYQDANLTEDEREYRLSFPEGNLKRIESLPPAIDLGIWLAKVRDNKSWTEIARVKYPASEEVLEARKSAAIRAYHRVERYLVKNEQG